MQTSIFSAQTSINVLMLSQRESSIRTDLSTLRSIGITSITQHHTSSSALSFLESKMFSSSTKEKNIDVIICDERFENRLIFHFLLKLARNQKFAQIPILLISSSPSTAEIAEKCGVNILSRPYAQQQLLEALHTSMSPLHKALNAQKLSAYCLAVSGEKKNTKKPSSTFNVATTSDYIKMGFALMKQGELDLAEQKFLAVLKRNEDNVEANIALAKLYRAKNDAPATTSFLLRAAGACQRSNDFKHAASIRALLPENMRNCNIFHQEATVALRSEDYRTAALSFLEYCAENPEQPLYAAIARGCQMTRQPYEALKNICNAYDRLGKKDLAEKIRRRLIAEPRIMAQEAPSWLDKFPRLREAITVASFTARAWRQA